MNTAFDDISLGARWSASIAALLAGCSSPEQQAQQYYESGMALIAKGDDLNAQVALLTSAKYKSDELRSESLGRHDERTVQFAVCRPAKDIDGPSDLDARLKLRGL